MGAHIIPTVALNSELMGGLCNAVSPWERPLWRTVERKDHFCDDDTFNSLDLKRNSLKRTVWQRVILPRLIESRRDSLSQLMALSLPAFSSCCSFALWGLFSLSQCYSDSPSNDFQRKNIGYQVVPHNLSYMKFYISGSQPCGRQWYCKWAAKLSAQLYDFCERMWHSARPLFGWTTWLDCLRLNWSCLLISTWNSCLVTYRKD